MSFISGIVEGVTGAVSGIGNFFSLFVGMVAVLGIFAISQIFIFGQVALIGWGFLKIKDFLEKSEIIPRATRVYKMID